MLVHLSICILMHTTPTLHLAPPPTISPHLGYAAALVFPRTIVFPLTYIHLRTLIHPLLATPSYLLPYVQPDAAVPLPLPASPSRAPSFTQHKQRMLLNASQVEIAPAKVRHS
jgi:hypothetical protein